MNTYSKQQLYLLRNQIPINELIYNILPLKSIYQNIWRFQCPVCHEFNTATQEKTNLARCFLCKQNFNTIDLVIYAKKFNFKQSVEFLLPYLKKFENNKIQSNSDFYQNKTPPDLIVPNFDFERARQNLEKMKKKLNMR